MIARAALLVTFGACSDPKVASFGDGGLDGFGRGPDGRGSGGAGGGAGSGATGGALGGGGFDGLGGRIGTAASGGQSGQSGTAGGGGGPGSGGQAGSAGTAAAAGRAAPGPGSGGAAGSGAGGLVGGGGGVVVGGTGGAAGRGTAGAGGGNSGSGGFVGTGGRGTGGAGTGGVGTGGSGTGGAGTGTGGAGTGGAGTGGAGTGGAGTGGAGTGGMAVPPVLDGSTAARAAGSCRDIMALPGTHVDGVYWIRPDSGSPVRRVFCDMTSDGGGWTMVFKLTDGLEGDALELWNGPALNDAQVDLLGRHRSSQNYVSSLMAQNWNVGTFGVREVVLHFNVAGRRAAFAKFDGKQTTPRTWFEKERLLQSSWTDLTPTAVTNYFGIAGDLYFIRHFIANRSYGDCPNDVGWFMVGNGWYCAWETPFTAPAQRVGPISLVFSNLTTAALWVGISNTQADTFTVYVR